MYGEIVDSGFIVAVSVKHKLLDIKGFFCPIKQKRNFIFVSRVFKNWYYSSENNALLYSQKTGGNIKH